MQQFNKSLKKLKPVSKIKTLEANIMEVPKELKGKFSEF
jgi:hypothetical protein